MTVSDVQWSNRKLIYESHISGIRTYLVPAAVDDGSGLVVCKAGSKNTSMQSLPRESHMLDKVHGENIVKKLEYDALANHLFLGYCAKAQTASAYLARKDRTLPFDLAVSRDMAYALAQVHRAGVVHNDVSPENYLINGRVTMIDFAGSYDVKNPPLSFRRSFLHSGRYCPPEKEAGRLDLGRESDVFFLGAILFDLLVPYTSSGTEDGSTELSGKTEEMLLRAVHLDHHIRPTAAEISDTLDKELSRF